jgi:hypothetical protein
MRLRAINPSRRWPRDAGSNDLIDNHRRLVREQVELALIATARPAAAIHIDLALLQAEQAQLAEALCADGEA